ncbi:SLAIN motif-containing protein-like isoform X2 [Fundulus heteroclitus]|uniref:SLAIN motif-containing protein-like isoform X2 n=1 Tax=Fundulus heteroclitus TaxID=8078 RepID=UPI00165C3D53|nr:SLAIN motif-containing protein-like isoform X2 [Fundulus heteroclitus]
MVVPDSSGVAPEPDNAGLTESPDPVCAEAGERGRDLAGTELEEVRKLQELVRRLEVQNETLRNRGAKTAVSRGANSNLSPADNVNKRLTCDQLRLEQGGGLGCLLSPPQDSSSSSGEDMSPLPVTDRLEEEDEEEERVEEEDVGPCGGFLALTCANGGERPRGQSQTPESPSQESYESETLTESDSGVDQTALDEVDVLDLEDEGGEVEDEDSWLYVSPRKQAAEQRPDSPLKWCRQALDHRTPETEMACRTLISRLDQRVPSMHSALSSQSSIDSELSTSDDSISMGYKLQDLTDVQIMARLQEESLRQDYASSSASASRRSSTTSLQSLRRGGTYSDQEFDTYSLEDEEDELSPAPQRQHRFTPSPLGSPRCLSPSTASHGQEYAGRLGAPRARAPRRSLQGPSAELLKFAKSEEELRHSMPNLAPRTSLRSLEAVRNSRSMEANLQSSGNRMSHLTRSPSTGMACSRLRSSNGQSPLTLRTPVKAVNPVGSVSAGRQTPRGLPVIQSLPATGGRRVQSPGSVNGGGYAAGRASVGGGRPAVGRGQAASSVCARSKLAQPSRRSLGMTKLSDESWKDGCY